MKTLRSGGNLFIEYPSVAHSSPSNKQLALIYACCIINPSRHDAPNRTYVRMCVYVCVCEEKNGDAVCQPAAMYCPT